ncbi:lanthionine synthetase LanC family protein [Streptomyces olivaceus]|uniref:lanthionine synthetase LanC family protein n=1 Tax=Streptomyces olivaceus TaxID=47716 RepID=UPI0037FAE75A
MTAPGATHVAVGEVEDVAVDGLRWLLGAARETPGGGLAWPAGPSDDALDPMLYSGTAGTVPVLLEAWRHFGDDSYADAALRAARELAARADDLDDDSLGTAGVLALACDRIAGREGDQDTRDFAGVLVTDLVARAVRDADGARWSNFDHRSTPGDLEPQTGWAMGGAGIVRELLRFVRVARGGSPRYAFTWPDQPPVPA